MLPLRLRSWLAANPRNVTDETENNSANSSEPIHPSEPSQELDGFTPTIWDVLKVRYLLQWKVGSGLPTELVDAIIDAAEYWPSTESHMNGGERIIGTDRDQVLVKTVPLCYERRSLERTASPQPLPHRTAHPCRKIIFQLSSHDQGFGRVRDNMYEHSWTWFDTEVIRGAHAKKMYVDGVEQEILDNERGQVKKSYAPTDDLLLPRDNKLQVNGAHVSEMQNRVIIWHYLDNIAPDSEEARIIERRRGRGQATLDGRGVRGLEIGDSIALWARARFPGWTNHVSRASVRVYWAV